MKLSICIPTYNRANQLTNCLESIALNENHSLIEYEVCVSDNFSDDNTEEVVKSFENKIPISYVKNERNIGRVRNYLQVVSIAKGDFIWLLGDDDLLLPNALIELDRLMFDNNNVEFFYINSYCLDYEYLSSSNVPFHTKDLPQNMTSFSSWRKDGSLKFLDLINPKISFDFLGGMFLSVFKRDNWLKNVHVLNIEAIDDLREFSHYDNTFPHVKIFAKAFANSEAYFHSNSLSVNLSGVREWSNFSPLVNSIRLPESLREFRNNGLSFFKYILYKNFALKKFIPDLIKMYIYKGPTGFEYVSPLKLVFFNCIFPNFYLSIIYFFFQKIKTRF
jgi:glycosyltransferase involved in cell wall biosynthesis